MHLRYLDPVGVRRTSSRSHHTGGELYVFVWQLTSIWLLVPVELGTPLECDASASVSFAIPLSSVSFA